MPEAVKNWRATGKSPVHDRALELLRQGRSIIDVQVATRTPSAIIKRWARAAGIPYSKPTAADRADREARSERNVKARRAQSLSITAEVVKGPIVGDHKARRL